jgi:hypothetical protein
MQLRNKAKMQMKMWVVDLLVRLRTILTIHQLLAWTEENQASNSLLFRFRRITFSLKRFPLYLRFQSQLAQDLGALRFNNFKEGGFFVEIGAANGKRHSNTYLLEKKFHWVGLVVEPAQIWRKSLIRNRSCNIDFRFVGGIDHGTIEFVETSIPTFSTAQTLISSDLHSSKRQKNVKIYTVASVSLNTLLDEVSAPINIDYLSLDTEGSELEILSAFDWSKYNFGFITIEHNFSSNREKMNDLLTRNGYVRILTGISRFDDWFIPR